ncbi:preprotein translocase subunit SecA [Novipirellula artificiosorum]|uniref:Preprotein translocase subunit SecA n=1 Tax=Novipirellula artificiosorum TaxID=2528016 RepID=A0A5C6E3Q0_9BACT|nr:hypothetical protein [Novipirellula artificiosorum]TWU42607.1 preprotein translocase subunit SecA [Novipirellula artificiosorum]
MQLSQIRQSVADRLRVELRETQVTVANHLLGRGIVEMETGEGKTLAIAVAAIAMASNGRTVNIATANDYLARRDADWMHPIYDDLGITVDAVSASCSMVAKQSAYAASVTYGTLRQFGFDYLQQEMADREARRRHAAAPPRQSPRMDVLIVDEADNVLIDEARTPLIVTSSTGPIDSADRSAYLWAAQIARSLSTSCDYVVPTDTNAVALTPLGYSKLSRSPMPADMNSMTTTAIVHFVERAIESIHRLRRDQHYILLDNRVFLVDEFTGRTQPDRSFADGMQQAIEAREGVNITCPSQPVARITLQELVTRFKHLSGTTGTAWEDRRELAQVYGLPLERVAPHRPSRRTVLPTTVCVSEEDKFERIVDEVESMVAGRRAVLLGTRTIEKSETLSRLLHSRSLPHVVLNARHRRHEAELIAAAGTEGRVTVATNMAGRGTDIQVSDRVRQSGGLHVIVSELHPAARIDRQLAGRCARQGDPGSVRTFVSPDDEVVEMAFGPDKANRIRASRKNLGWIVRRAQSIVSRQHRRGRIQLTQQGQSIGAAMRQLGLDPNLDPLAP